MTTFLKDFVSTNEDKWEEIDLLIKTAQDIQDEDEKLYNAICRSLTVLLVAHLEGFTKDIVKCFIQDLNRNCGFSELPIAVKRTYCKKYLGNKPDGKGKSFGGIIMLRVSRL